MCVTELPMNPLTDFQLSVSAYSVWNFPGPPGGECQALHSDAGFTGVMP